MILLLTVNKIFLYFFKNILITFDSAAHRAKLEGDRVVNCDVVEVFKQLLVSLLVTNSKAASSEEKNCGGFPFGGLERMPNSTSPTMGPMAWGTVDFKKMMIDTPLQEALGLPPAGNHIPAPRNHRTLHSPTR